MKRFLVLLCALSLLLLCACSAPPPEAENTPAPTQAVEISLAPTPERTPEPTPEPTPTPVPVRYRHVIPEGATEGPEPDPASFGSISLDEPEKALAVLDRARELGLLREDETVIFDPKVDFYRGADRQDIEYYLDETILVICWKEVVDGCTCSYAEIRIAEPSQLRRKLAYDSFDPAQRLFLTEMHAQTHAVLSLNADFYQNRDVGLMVYDRTLYRYPEYAYGSLYTFSNCLETCLVDSKGDFHYTDLGQEFSREAFEQYLQENDILFSLAFGPVLIRDGVVQDCTWYPVGEVLQIYSRAGIGIVDDLHYLYMSLNHAPEKAGSWTVNQFARHFGEKAVRTAYCLDGGQTGEMVFQGRPYAHMDFGEERRVSDCIYFVTGLGAPVIEEPILDPVP